MEINELLQRKKYMNINNLLRAVYSNSFDSNLIDRIDNSEFATICYLLVQLKINQQLINNLCGKFVYDFKSDIDLDKMKKLIDLKGEILSNYRLNIDMLKIPIEPTKERLNRHLILIESGYHTYGDFEIGVSYYLAPYFSVESFTQMLKASKKLIESTKFRFKLTDYLKTNLKAHFKSIELEIAQNQKKI
jgi:hypothetical protein